MASNNITIVHKKYYTDKNGHVELFGMNFVTKKFDTDYTLNIYKIYDIDIDYKKYIKYLHFVITTPDNEEIYYICYYREYNERYDEHEELFTKNIEKYYKDEPDIKAIFGPKYHKNSNKYLLFKMLDYVKYAYL